MERKQGRRIWRMVLAAVLLAGYLPLPEGVVLSLAGRVGVGAPSAYAAECTSTVMNQITAAFNTQGYWVQADLVHQIANTDLGLWAPLLYILAVFFGLLMLAMGQPPKVYMWWVLGPAIYNWILFTPASEGRKAVCWNVATTKQDMKQVYRLAEVGFINLNKVKRDGVSYNVDSGPGGEADELPMVFVWFDDLVSAQIEYLVAWSGINTQLENNGGKTFTHQKPGGTGGGGGGGTDGGDDRAWHILTNSKWPMLENITGASLHNQDLKSAFIRFMAGECGDILARHIDQAAFMSAGYAKGSKLPDSVFKGSGGGGAGGGGGEYDKLGGELASKYVPMPAELVNVLNDRSIGNLTEFDSYFNDAKPEEVKAIGCQAYLYTLIQGFRWESGIAYNQVVSHGADSGIDADNVVYSFLYGWRVGPKGQKLSPEDQRHFVQNLILLYLIRNELAHAPNPADRTYSSSERNENYVKAYARNIGSKAKFGELYMWAKLMPYIQGVLLYLLAATYPFACILIIIPGWHKSLLSWMGFYAWAKSWDAGFAIVMALERSIWGMVGNTLDAARFNDVVNDMKDYGQIRINGGETVPDITGASCSEEKLLGCMLPKVQSATGTQDWENAIKIFDKGLIMSSNLDIDMANAYYIYIMSALYFAVPAVTGQILLGAKAGASGMVSTAVGGVSQETGKAGGQGHLGDWTTKGHHAMAVTGQEGFAKGLRDSGLGVRAMQAGNTGAAMELMGSYGSGRAGISEMLGNQLRWAQGEYHNTSGAAVGAINAGRAVAGAAGKREGDPKQMGQGAAGAAWRGAKAAAGELPQQAATWGALDYGKQIDDMNMAYNRARMDGLMNQFEGSSMGRGFQAMGQRYQGLAQQQGGEAQWRSMQKLANQYAGQSAAMGVFAGAFTAGAKPMHVDGMVGMGQLSSYSGSNTAYDGHDGQAAFGWMDPNNKQQGYGAAVRAYKRDLSRYSKDADRIYAAAGTSSGSTARHGQDVTSRAGRTFPFGTDR